MQLRPPQSNVQLRPGLLSHAPAESRATHCPGQDAGLGSVMEGLRRNRTVTQLDLGSAALGERGTGLLAEAGHGPGEGALHGGSREGDDDALTPPPHP